MVWRTFADRPTPLQQIRMHPRIEEVLSYLERQHALLLDAVDSVPVERRNEAPGPHRWSPAGVLEHLAIVETSIGGLFAQRIAAARAAGTGAETDSSSVVSSFGPAATVVDRTRRIVSGERSRPTQQLDWEAAMRALETAHAGFRAALVSGDGLALGEVVHPHPVFGPLNLYHWAVFVGGHEARHAEQIRETGAAIERFKKAFSESDPSLRSG